MSPYLAAPSRLLEVAESKLKATGIRCVGIERRSTADWTHAARFWTFLRKERIDLVHSHFFVASLFASPLAKLAGVPAVVETFHLREIWREEKWIKGNFWVDRQIGRFVDRYIAVSHAVERHLIETKRISASKVTTIYNGRDLKRFRPRSPVESALARSELGVTENQVVLVLGRLEEQKGHVFLIEALRLLAPRWPNLVGLFAGTGALQGQLLAQSESSGLSNRIVFLGQRNDTERLLAAADVVALPSLFEGLPLVAIETLAMAKPILATDIDGTREVVVHGDTGLLARPADPAALAAGIERLLRDRALADRLAQRGRSVVERNFDVRIQVARTAEVYRRLLEGKFIRPKRSTESQMSSRKHLAIQSIGRR
jgi:glycosyltransferase involved in cell wall biosynthesis